MKFLKESNDGLKIYEITYCTAYFEDDDDLYDMEYDRDFPGYTIVYAEDEDKAEELFYKEFSTHEIMHIEEISESEEDRVRSKFDFVDFYN